MTDLYNAALVALTEANIDWRNDTIRVALLSDSVAYTPSIDSEQYVADVLDGGTTAQEFTGSGYSRQTLTGVSISQDNTDDEAVVDADDVTFPTVDGDTVQGVLVYQQVGADDSTPGDDRLIGYYDGNDYPKAANGSDFVVEWSTEGVYNLTN